MLTIISDTADIDEHFPTISLDDDIWTEELVPDRHLCIYHLDQPPPQSSHQCPFQSVPAEAYDNIMTINNILDFEDMATTTGDEDEIDMDLVFEP